MFKIIKTRNGGWSFKRTKHKKKDILKKLKTEEPVSDVKK